MSHKRMVKVLVMFLVVGVVLAATPAYASPAGGRRIPGSRRGTSTNWSGYAVETSLTAPQSGVVTDVHAHWTVTTVTPTAMNAYSSTWVGIDGYSSSTVEQIGTEADWQNGVAVYYAWYEMYPKRAYLIRNFAVHPGDVISGEVTYTGNRRFQLTLTNLTTARTFTLTQKTGGNVQRSSAEWIVEAPYSGGVLPLADFGTVPFTNASATIGGHTGGINDSLWAFDAISMVNASSGTTEAVPSALSSAGDAFSVTWFSAN